MFGRKTLEFMLICIGDEMRDSLTIISGEDAYCIIDFASKAEVSNFVNSMRKAKSKQEGTLFSHPKNDWGKICVRVNNRRVKILCPSHTVPDDF